MAKTKFQNVSPAILQDKKPGDVFRLETDGAGVPTEAYWRRRLDETAIAPFVLAAPTPEPVPEPVALPEVTEEAPTATVARAARKQKD